jgi:hypothetical protein
MSLTDIKAKMNKSKMNKYSNSVLQLYSFDSGYSLVVLEDDGEV